MMKKEKKQQSNLLRSIPPVDMLLNDSSLASAAEKFNAAYWSKLVKSAVQEFRSLVLEDSWQGSPEETPEAIRGLIFKKADNLLSRSLKKVINATGVIIHTGLGRSTPSRAAVQSLFEVSGGYNNLEIDLKSGHRGDRNNHTEELLCFLFDAEASLVVNNNAGAVMLVLDSTASGKEVIVSRGELVEIGGGFRMPDVMQKSGANLVEVGTTNKTYIEDYSAAITPDTGLILKVHTSNFRTVGFHHEAGLRELVELGRTRNIPVFYDLGSGSFFPFSPDTGAEPTISESLQQGIDAVMFSGDKLLGASQAGIILGKKNYVDAFRKNPLTRALRIDKLTLAVLESTLREYLLPEKARKNLPTLKMLTEDVKTVEIRAQKLISALRDIGKKGYAFEIKPTQARVGGGALPLTKVDSRAISVSCDGKSITQLSEQLRTRAVPILGRIYKEEFLLDMKTVFDDQTSLIVEAFREL